MKSSKILSAEELGNFYEYYFYIYENYLTLSLCQILLLFANFYCTKGVY